ncbi:MAG TPA: hypothetical protein VFZ18_02250 [Longimicrobiaceae bacterium]
MLVTLDLIGVPAWVTEEVARRLAPAGVERSRLVITATHTHNAPELVGVLPTHLTALGRGRGRNPAVHRPARRPHRAGGARCARRLCAWRRGRYHGPLIDHHAKFT